MTDQLLMVMFVVVVIFIIFSIISTFGHIHTDRFVRHCGYIYYNFGQVHHVNVRRCQFFVMFSVFGHLDSVK